MVRNARVRRPRLRAVEPGFSADDALEVLFRRHYAALTRVAYAMLGSREGAEDAVQDAYVSLYRHWDRLRDPGAAEAYLRSAVLNRCRSRIRDVVRRRQLDSAPDVVPLTAEGSDDAAVRDDQDAGLRRAVRRLPRRQREVVAYRYLMELSVTETAAALGISEGAVKRHAHRGIRTLRSTLEVAR